MRTLVLQLLSFVLACLFLALCSNSDGLIDFDEFRAMDKAFPLLFFPAFRLQDSLQKHFLGAWWPVKYAAGRRPLGYFAE